MSKRVTYLVGAGASYHSLPLIATMGDRMRIFLAYLKQLQRTNTPKHNPGQFIEELEKVLEEESKSTSIDAYAKELSDTGKETELHHLKMVLGGYFVFEQMRKDSTFQEWMSSVNNNERNPPLYNELNTTLDKRYRTFWGDVTNGREGVPPPGTNILSWNYDMQFETAYAGPRGHSVQLVQNNLQVFPGAQLDLNLEKFCLLKLNGTAGLFKNYNRDRPESQFDMNNHPLDPYNIGIMMEIFNRNYHRAFSSPIFTFACEDTPIAQKTRLLAKEIMSNTQILVIIGYSFPRLNKEVDGAIFSEAKNLERIFLQVPPNDIGTYTSRLGAINPMFAEMVVPETDLGSFFIPNEL